MKNNSNFSNSYTIGLNITKPPPLIIEGFSIVPRTKCVNVVWGTSI